FHDRSVGWRVGRDWAIIGCLDHAIALHGIIKGGLHILVNHVLGSPRIGCFRFASTIAARRTGASDISFVRFPVLLPAVLMSITLVGFGLPARSEPSPQERAWNTRMNVCVKALQHDDKALRNNWRGHCGVTDLAAGSAAAERLRNIFVYRVPIE